MNSLDINPVPAYTQLALTSARPEACSTHSTPASILNSLYMLQVFVDFLILQITQDPFIQLTLTVVCVEFVLYCILALLLRLFGSCCLSHARLLGQAYFYAPAQGGGIKR